MLFDAIKLKNLGTIPHRALKQINVIKESDTAHIVLIPLIYSDLCDLLKERIKKEIGEFNDITAAFVVKYLIDKDNDEMTVSTGFKVFYDNGKSQNMHIWLIQNNVLDEITPLLQVLKPYIDKKINTKNLLPKE